VHFGERALKSSNTIAHRDPAAVDNITQSDLLFLA
jgi:hypothetical protein